MSYLRGMAIVPHPPILLPQIGQGEEEKAKATILGLQKIASLVKEKSPETIICITPHGNVFADGICILDDKMVEGNLEGFGRLDLSMKKEIDVDLLKELDKLLVEKEMPSVFLSEKLAEEYEVSLDLDHGTIVPLYFIDQEYTQYKIIHITIGMMSLSELYEIGSLLGAMIEETKKKTMILISGDLSHCLTEDAPHQYNPKGKVFDELIVKAIEGGRVEEILLIPEDVAEDAAECGLRPIVMGLGVMDGYKIEGKIYSYEAPYGVGYLNASIEALGKDESILSKLHKKRHIAYLGKKRIESIPVALARATIEEWIGKGHQLDWENFQDLILQSDVVQQLEENKAGVFVSIDKKGELRGCMGTYIPTQRNIAEEIINNAIMAAWEDPRFTPLRENELEDIEIKVDILHKLEKIDNLDALDVSKYGVFVERGDKSGLLLPNIEGVDTPQQQVEIAKEKAEIAVEEAVSLYRFEVTRYK